jgi:hypothetical protein
MSPSNERYTCIGKGGEYERVGTALGAGSKRGSDIIQVYRDQQGQLYYRESSEFFKRMALTSTVKTCAASIGGTHCQVPRADGSLFCGQHRHADSRQHRAQLTNEGLAFMMQRDGEQQ